MPAKLNPILKILAIDPGTREMGIAVLANQELEYYAVKTITRRDSASSILKQTRAIIRKLISIHNPQILAIERPFLGYGNRSSTLVTVCQDLRQLGKQHGCQIVDVNPKTAKKLVAGAGSATKREVARVVCSRFPELQIYLSQPHKYQEKYWQNMFDAVGIALAAKEIKNLS
jgi:Holliday junction resolvasome RuvABC endonuclease subunit